MPGAADKLCRGQDLKFVFQEDHFKEIQKLQMSRIKSVSVLRNILIILKFVVIKMERQGCILHILQEIEPERWDGRRFG